MNAVVTEKLSPAALNRRNREMRRLRELGIRDVDIARKFRLTRARVGQILGASGRGNGAR
jgi:U3 small nucleolar RNA-associated protein 14